MVRDTIDGINERAWEKAMTGRKPLKDLGYNHYQITRKLALQLTSGKLPRPGYEKLVTHQGANYWLLRTPVLGRMVWALHGPSHWQFVNGIPTLCGTIDDSGRH